MTSKHKIISQVYIIKKVASFPDITSDFPEHVFINYSESRKKALKLVRNINKNNKNRFVFTQSQIHCELIEISPDIWTNGSATISIEVLPVKDFVFRKNKPVRKIHLETNNKMKVTIKAPLAASHEESIFSECIML